MSSEANISQDSIVTPSHVVQIECPPSFVDLLAERVYGQNSLLADLIHNPELNINPDLESLSQARLVVSGEKGNFRVQFLDIHPKICISGKVNLPLIGVLTASTTFEVVTVLEAIYSEYSAQKVEILNCSFKYHPAAGVDSDLIFNEWIQSRFNSRVQETMDVPFKSVLKTYFQYSDFWDKVQAEFNTIADELQTMADLNLPPMPPSLDSPETESYP